MRVLAAGALVVLATASGFAADALVDVHRERARLWAVERPSTPEKLAQARKAAVALEKTTRAPVLQAISDEMRRDGLAPPVPSGSPPVKPSGSGILTDIDDTYRSMSDLNAAARKFETRGYTVHWETPDSFTVKRLDYTGFSAEPPRFRPGSIEAERFERAATKFVDKVFTVGGQEWVHKRVKPAAAVSDLGKARTELEGRLATVSGPERAALETRLAQIRTEVARAQQLMREPLIDGTGFVVDMWKKGSHHLDPNDWCPPGVRFACAEEPRQAAKAAARILDEMPSRTAAHTERLTRLQQIASGTRLLPADTAAFRTAADALRQDIRQAFSDGHARAVDVDRLRARQEVERLGRELRAARHGGEAARIAEAEANIARHVRGQRETAARLAGTLDGIRQQPDGIARLYEAATGRELRKVVIPGGETYYLEPGDLRRRVRLTPDQVRETGARLIKKEIVRAWDLAPEGLPKAPRASSFAPPEPASGLGSLGKLDWAILGATALMNASEAVEEAAKGRGRDVLAWSDIRQGRITADRVKGWAWTTTVGTALTVGDLSGFRAGWQAGTAAMQPARPGEPPPSALWAATAGIGTVLGGGVGRGVYDRAEALEIETAAREGRAATKEGVLRILLQNVTGQWLTDPNSEWWKLKGAEIGGWARAWAGEARAEFDGWREARALEDRLGAGGLDQLLDHVEDLRRFSTELARVWDTGTQALDREIASEGRLSGFLAALAADDPDRRCREMVAGLGPAPALISVGYAHDRWLAREEARAERVREALLAAYDAHGATAVYRASLEHARTLAGALDRQSALKVDLEGRLRRLALVLPGDGQLAALQNEVAAFAPPFPVAEIPKSLQDSEVIAQRIDAAVRRLVDLAARPPQCRELADRLAKADPAVADPKPGPIAPRARTYFVFYRTTEFTCCKGDGALRESYPNIRPDETPHPVRIDAFREWESTMKKLAGPFPTAAAARAWLCGQKIRQLAGGSFARIDGVMLSGVPCPGNVQLR